MNHTIDEWVKKEKENLDKFLDYWKKENQKDPDNFPLTDYSAEWDEQYLVYLNNILDEL